MAQGVVDNLEAIQIDHQQGQFRLAALGQIDDLRQSFVKVQSIGQLG